MRSLNIMFLCACSIALSVLAACSVFAPQADTVAKDGAKLIKFYCDNVADPTIRANVAAAVNKYASPDAVQVTCAVAPQTPLVVPSTPH